MYAMWHNITHGWPHAGVTLKVGMRKWNWLAIERRHIASHFSKFDISCYYSHHMWRKTSYIYWAIIYALQLVLKQVSRGIGLRSPRLARCRCTSHVASFSSFLKFVHKMPVCTLWLFFSRFTDQLCEGQTVILYEFACAAWMRECNHPSYVITLDMYYYSVPKIKIKNKFS